MMNRPRSRSLERGSARDDYLKRFDSRRRRNSRTRRRRSRRSSSSTSGSSRSRSNNGTRRRRRRSYSRSKSSSPVAVDKHIVTIDLDAVSPPKPPWVRNNSYPQPTQFNQQNRGFQNVPPYPPPLPGQPMVPQHYSGPPPTTSASFQQRPTSVMGGIGQYPTMPNVSEAPPPPSIEGAYPGYQNSSVFQPTFADGSYRNYDNPPPVTSNAPWQNQVFSPPPPLDYEVPRWEGQPDQSTSNLIYPGQERPPQNQPCPQPPEPGPSVEEEMAQQKRTLLKQREEYVKKNSSLHRELARLKQQRQELLTDSSEDSERFLKENTKLQNEIGQRLKAIENVVEMLTGLIGDSFDLSKCEKAPPAKTPLLEKLKKMSDRKMDNPEEVRMREKTGEPGEHGRVEEIIELDSPSHASAGHSGQSFNYNIIHYDPELHWCSLCNVFPKTIVAYLNHLHTPEHKAQIIRLKLDESPWHGDIPQESVPPFTKDAPSKRMPIRGVQFLVPSTGWYCRLCKVWLGDLHCCSNHLKGSKHWNNYGEYVCQNPHWEVDWLADRTRSYERSSEHLARIKDNSGAQIAPPTSSESEKAQINVLSNTLLAVLAQQNKGKVRMKDSSSSFSSSSSDESAKKSKKSKKKKKKKKRKGTPSKSPSRPKSPNLKDDSLISEWMAPKEDPMPKVPFSNSKIEIMLSRNRFNRQKDDRDSRPAEKDSQIPKSYRNSRNIRDSREAGREMSRDAGRDSGRDGSRDLGRDGNRDLGRDGNRDSVRDGNRDSGRDYRDPGRDTNRDSGRDMNPKDVRDIRGFQRKDVPKDNKRDNRDQSRADRESPRDLRKRDGGKVDDRDSRIEEKKRALELRYGELKKDKPPEKPKGNLWFPSSKDEEETSFEKQSAESAAKRKAENRKPTQFTLPKTKLPFIGRMPILKKKPDLKPDEKPEEVSKPSEEEKQPAKGNFWPNIPNVADEEEAAAAEQKPSLPKSTLIISKRPRLGEAEDPSGKSAQSDPKKKTKATEDNLAEQDMDIECDDQDTVIWEGNEGTAETNREETPKEELHKDFKEALDLLFPEEGKEPPKTDAEEGKPDESEAYKMSGPVWLPTGVPPPTTNQGFYPANYTSQPPPGYYGPGFDNNYGGAFYQPAGYGAFPGQMVNTTSAPPPTGVPIAVPPPSGTAMNVPPPVITLPAPNIVPGPVPAPEAAVVPQGQEESEEDEAAPRKRKNPLSQRMRRHLKKKKAEEEAKAETANLDEGKKKYEGMDMSDLAMLGIDEGDSTAQQF